MRKYVFLQLPWKTCNTLQQLYLKKHKILLIFSHPSAIKFLLVGTDNTQTVRLFDSSSSATRSTHVIWVQSYEVLHGAGTVHKTSKTTNVLSFLFVTRTRPTSKNSITLTIIGRITLKSSLFWGSTHRFLSQLPRLLGSLPDPERSVSNWQSSQKSEDLVHTEVETRNLVLIF